jgi:hypothetical protein
MEREFAVRYLMNECVFDEPLTEQRATEIWQERRDQVDQLPERQALAPARLPLTPEERERANAFLRFHSVQLRQGPIRDVIKINPLGLVTHQPYICLDRVNDHVVDGNGGDTLCTQMRPHQMMIQSGMNSANVHVPHGEFGFFYDPIHKLFTVSETGRHVSVSEFQGRMILWAGYHRSYACMVNENPEGIERSLLVALTTDADFFVSEHSPNQGLRAMVCGLRPPLLADFFDERFFMAVRLRKKRFELQIRAQIVPVNVDA